MTCGSHLFFEIGKFLLHRSMMLQMLQLRFLELPAQLGVLPQQNERDEGSGDRQDCEEDDNQLNKFIGHWASLGVLGRLFQC